MTETKQCRLLAIERAIRVQARELAALRATLPDAVKTQRDNAVLVSMNRRLIGENDRLRERLTALGYPV